MKINPEPIEYIQIDDLPKKEIFVGHSLIESTLIVNKEDFVAGLLYLMPGEEIAQYFDRIDKSFYVLDGIAQALINGEMLTIKQDDSLFVPKNSVTQFKNRGNAICRVFYFYPSGPVSSIQHQRVTESTMNADLIGKGIAWVDQRNVPYEGWDGIIPSDQMPPLAWKTLIDNQSMVLGSTRINPSYDVDAHFHIQSQIVIFSGGEGRTKIKGKDYRPLKMLSAIYVPNNSIHHTIATGTTPLKEIYFFPQGPFSSIIYNKVDPVTERLLVNSETA